MTPPRTSPVLVSAARHGLAPAADLPDPNRSYVDHDLAAVARFDGLSGFLAAALSDGSVVGDDGAMSEVQQDWLRAAVGSAQVEALAVRTARVFDAAGVRWRLTKGAALAHLDYAGQLSERTFGDMDVVVHPADWNTAQMALTRSGYRRVSPELRPGYDIRFGKGATIEDPLGLEVDLHLRFAVGRFGLLARPHELFGRSDQIVLAGQVIPTLAGPDRLLHACHHLVLGGFSGLRAARDVAQLLLVSRVDWVHCVHTATAWGVEAVVGRGVTLAWERLRLEVDHPAIRWARGHRITSAERRALRVFEEERPFREQALTALPVLPVSLLPAYVAALAVPLPGARRSGRVSRLSHLVSRARALVAGARRRRSAR